MSTEEPGKVVIVGRPNVGKSSLFNQLIKRRVAIVEDEPGVTRDRLESYVMLAEGHTISLIDTGGIGLNAEGPLDLNFPIEVGIKKADLFIFVVDARSGLHPNDEVVAQKLREAQKPVILIANKADTRKIGQDVSDFWSMGLGEPMAYSVHEGLGLEELKKRLKDLTPAVTLPEEEDVPRIALLGKRNSGKSTLMNFLSSDKRVIVSDQAGTTRDFVEVRIDRFSRPFILVDTAGMKRPHWESTVDFFSIKRTERVIRECNAVLLLIDGNERVSGIDKKLTAALRKYAKPAVIAINKWDLIPSEIKTNKFMDYLDQELRGIPYAPVGFISALRGDNVRKLLETLFEVVDQGQTRVSTGRLNRLVESALARRSPPVKGGQQAKIMYVSQVEVGPPTFVFKVNNSRLVTKEYRRYLENFLRDALEMEEIPLKLVFRSDAG